jgi:excinuclease ABC subunit C
VSRIDYESSVDEVRHLVKRTPCCPGVYLMKDVEGQIIYIGKAKNLKKRLSSYFERSSNVEDWKTTRLVKKVVDIEFVLTDNETEAFLLEANLIKQYRPLFNIELKDQQRFTYLRITDEVFPRLLVTRRNRAGKFRDHSGKIFGPFVRGSSRYLTVGLLRKLFKIRICNRLPKKPCLEYFIGNCDAPCIHNVTQQEYMANIHALGDILSGKETINKFISTMADEMKDASLALKYEKAKEIRDTIRRLENLRSRQKMENIASHTYEEYVGILHDEFNGKAYVLILRRHHGVIRDRRKFEFELVGDNSLSTFLFQYYSSIPTIPYAIYVNYEPKSKNALENSLGRIASHKVEIIKLSLSRLSERSQLMNLIVRNLAAYIEKGIEPGLVELQQILEVSHVPKIIDAFDVSNLGDTIAVGSCVRFLNGRPDKSYYRRFRIRAVSAQNDFAMIEEIVRRRYTRTTTTESEYPDLILIDGGRGQLNAALRALTNMNLRIPCISLAKGNEEIFTARSSVPIVLSNRSVGLQILRATRDEAHRFGLDYNIKLRGK